MSVITLKVSPPFMHCKKFHLGPKCPTQMCKIDPPRLCNGNSIRSKAGSQQVAFVINSYWIYCKFSSRPLTQHAEKTMIFCCSIKLKNIKIESPLQCSSFSSQHNEGSEYKHRGITEHSLLWAFRPHNACIQNDLYSILNWSDQTSHHCIYSLGVFPIRPKLKLILIFT